MQEENLDYLSKQLKYTGFKDDLVAEMKKHMMEGADHFVLNHNSKIGSDNVDASLFIKKSTMSDMYFFNNYRLSVVQANNEGASQIFYISNKEDNITLKEGYNLLLGRAVLKELTPKEGEKYNAWVQLDFKQTEPNCNYVKKTFHPNYGFDLESTLAKLPIKELANEMDKKMLMQSLERGNRQSVTYLQGDTEKKMFIEAAPQFKSINMYDMDMRRLKPEQLAPETGKQQAAEQKKSTRQKQSTDDENNPGNGRKKHSKKAGIS